MSISPLVFVILFALVCVAAFLVGLRFLRMAEPPGGATVDQVRRFGRLMMMAATAMLIFLVAIVIHGDLPLSGARALR
jgi:hypothetical protein